MKKVLAINLGSTSTKVAYFEDEDCAFKENITHPASELCRFGDVFDQVEYRKAALLAFLAEKGVALDELDAIASRGPQTEPIPGGVYLINDAMIEQAQSGEFGKHVCSVGAKIALDLANEYGFNAYTVDTPCTDELQPLARYSGIPEIPRRSSFQALNHKAMARHYAKSIGKPYESLNLVVVMLGGGISVAAHKRGLMVDGPDALEGDGPFSNNRCGTVPAGALIKLCYDEGLTRDQALRRINGEAGLAGYLAETDTRVIERRINEGDEKAREVLMAMCYQTAKEIGACAAVLEGDVDAILLIGGMANSEFITREITKYVNFIAPVIVMPGEREMESLGLKTLDVLEGRETVKTFIARKG